MPFTQVYVHLVWATRDRIPMLEPTVEEMAHRAIRSAASRMGGHVYAVNGMPDHVHLVSTLPVTVSLARYVGQVKAESSGAIRRHGVDAFSWQAEYGAFTFSAANLDAVTTYVERQKLHHANASTSPGLERWSRPSDSLRSRRQE